MAGNKGEVNKKVNENFRNGLKLLYLFFFLLLIFLMGNACNLRLSMFAFPALVILVALGLLLKSVPLTLLAIALFGALFYLGPSCPPYA